MIIRNKTISLIILFSFLLSIILCLFPNTISVEGAMEDCYQVPHGIVAWWQGENNTKDIINGLDGTIHDGVTYSTGMVGKAFSFDGNLDYISVNSSGLLPYGASPRTIEMWIYTISESWDVDLHNVFWSGSKDVRKAFSIDMKDYPGIDFFTWADDIIYISSVIDTGWFHIAMTYDGALTLKAYVNGVPITKTLSGTLDTTVTDLMIGGGLNQTETTYYIGSLDEVSIYNLALTDIEILGIYNAGMYGKCVYKSYSPLIIK